LRHYSQFSEDALVDGLLRKVGVRNSWCFEVGAGDGIKLSNTRAFIEAGWQAVLIESHVKRFEKLKQNCPESYCFNETVSVSKGIDAILAQTPAPCNLDFGSIDIDGQDYYVWRAMQKYRPRIIVVEFSPYVGADYLPQANTDGQSGKNQAGLNVMKNLAVEKGYEVVAATFCNLICIAN